jgi:HEAT repeat protein
MTILTPVALLALLQLQDPSDRIIRDLADEHYEVREGATRMLLDMPPNNCLPILSRALHQQDPEVRARARFVLDQTAEKVLTMAVDQAASILSCALADPDPRIRAWAERTTATVQTPVMLPPTDPDSPFGTVQVTLIVAAAADSPHGTRPGRPAPPSTRP